MEIVKDGTIKEKKQLTYKNLKRDTWFSGIGIFAPTAYRTNEGCLTVGHGAHYRDGDVGSPFSPDTPVRVYKCVVHYEEIV